jgi:hypothetical protein
MNRERPAAPDVAGREQATAAQRHHDKLARGFRTVQREGGGVYELALFHAADLAALFRAAKHGDRNARRYSDLVAGLVRQIRAHVVPDRTAPLCLLCDAVFWRDGESPAAVVVVHAHRDQPTKAIGTVLCTRCCAAHQPQERLTATVLDKLRGTIPGLRELPPLLPPGTA